MGIDVALDDFGTSYSSLAYFHRLPVQLIKVDRDFVRDMLASEDDRTIVESIVFLAKKFARPVPAEALPQWLITWQREGFPDAS
ncbi:MULTISPECIES: EAL domain-containing protein [Halomonas]|uniref:EAL domain-containing protein n=1 Tax=Halomonadaceae TaxID=28256 RepID=UPI0025B7A44A|nr:MULTISPECIES: EAL domain-containing protein [Halomonas]MCD1651364.1 EAL domain-containing protein [Halomonas axialensis]MCD2087582.1 EAL domain-containing protein [Halomonas meridiana]